MKLCLTAAHLISKAFQYLQMVIKIKNNTFGYT